MVLTAALRLVFIFLRIRQTLPLIPPSHTVFNMSLLSALSYAFDTSMNVRYVSFLSCFDMSIMARSMKRWSQVEEPRLPPPWACVKGTCASMRLSISVSSMEPIAEDVVIPLWLFKLSLSPFPFQILVIWPRFQEVGISSSSQIVSMSGCRKFVIFSPGLLSISFLISVVDFPFVFFSIASVISSLCGGRLYGSDSYSRFSINCIVLT